MTVVNVMWSGGAAYASVHKVHQQILSQVSSNTEVHTWLLQGRGDESAQVEGTMLEWRASQQLLRGRGLWFLPQALLRARLRRQLLISGASVVLLDGIGVARLLLPVLRKLPHIRALVVFHGKTRLRHADARLFGGPVGRQVSLVAVSRTLAEALQRELGHPVLALRTAIDPANFQRDLFARDDARQVLGGDWEGRILLGAVGRLVPEKGYDFLLDVLAALVKQRPELHLLILGEGEQRQALEEKIRQHGLVAHITLAGHRADVARLYRAFDLMLIPSRSEGLGLVLQEAVMAGVPVVSSNLPVFVEQLGEAGVYVEPDDAAGWAVAIEQLLAGDKAALAARQYRQLAPEQAWDEFSRGYRELLAGAPVSAS